MSHDDLSDLFRVLDLTGVFANAVLGGLIARQEKLDPISFATLAVLSGLGGGLIRDVLLQHGTPVALTDSAYLITALAGAAITFVVRVDGRTWARLWPLIDALALGTWAAAGAQKTLAVGLGWMPAILLGTIRAVRDVVLRRVPGVLGGNTLYATCAITGSSVLVILSVHDHPGVGLVAATIVGAGLCLLARWRGWILPDADAWSHTRVHLTNLPPLFPRKICTGGTDNCVFAGQGIAAEYVREPPLRTCKPAPKKRPRPAFPQVKGSFCRAVAGAGFEPA